MNDFINKVKDFVLKNKKPVIITSAAVLAAVLVLVLVLVLLGGNDQPGKTDPTDPASQTDPADGKVEYKFTIVNQTGATLEDVPVSIYQDDTLNDLVGFAKTDENGVAAIKVKPASGYVAVLDGLPVGYDVKEFYPVTEKESSIILSAGGNAIGDLEGKLHVGDPVPNFSVTTIDGVSYTLSDLIAQGKPVILNFWYINCDPCKQEFPHMQEAYEPFKEDAVLICMNLDDTKEAIEQYRQESGIDLPFAVGDPCWRSALQIIANPTTAVIDRYGHLSILHVGTVPDTNVFTNLFAYYTSADYQHTTFQSLEDIVTGLPGDSAENPVRFSGSNRYELVVEPGQTVYCEFANVSNMQMQIASANASVVYGSQTYTAVDGVVSLTVNTPDPFTPAAVAISNTGSQKETFVVELSYQPGSLEAPFELTMGAISSQVAEGNDQGVFYSYTSTAIGELTITVKSATEGVEPYCVLYNQTSGVMVSTDETTVDPATGLYTLSLKVNAGDVVQFNAATMGNGQADYPAATLELNVSVADSEGAVDYTVTVSDKSGTPIPGVSLTITGDGVDMDVTTNSKGVVDMSLVAGDYTVIPNIPLGYQAEASSFQLTETNTDLKIVLEQVSTPTDPAPTDPRPTDPQPTQPKPTQPKPTQPKPTQPKPTDPAPTDPVPTEPEPTKPTLPTYTPDPDVEGETRENPLFHKGDNLTVDVKSGYTIYILIKLGAPDWEMTITGGDCTVAVNTNDKGKPDKTLTADGNGVVSGNVKIDEKSGYLRLDLTNTTAENKTYEILLKSPLGSHDNPQEISLGSFDGKVKKGNEQGYYFVYTAERDGNLTVTCTDSKDGVQYRLQIDKLSVSDTRSVSITSDEGNSVTLDVKAGEVLLISYAALQNDFGPFPASSFTLNASYE